MIQAMLCYSGGDPAVGFLFFISTVADTPELQIRSEQAPSSGLAI